MLMISAYCEQQLCAHHEQDLQLGGYAGHVGYGLLSHEARQRLRVLLHARPRQHHAPAACERVEQLLQAPSLPPACKPCQSAHWLQV